MASLVPSCYETRTDAGGWFKDGFISIENRILMHLKQKNDGIMNLHGSVSCEQLIE